MFDIVKIEDARELMRIKFCMSMKELILSRDSVDKTSPKNALEFQLVFSLRNERRVSYLL